MLTQISPPINNDVAQNPVSIPRLITCNNHAELLQTFVSLINVDTIYVQYFRRKTDTGAYLKLEKEEYQDIITLDDIDNKLSNITRINTRFNVGVKRNLAFEDNDNVQWRSFLIEFDDIPLNEQIPTIQRVCKENNLPLPTCVVFTGNKSFHCYWTLLVPVEPALGADIQLRFINLFTGSDENFKSAVLASRLPGFIHRKTGKVSKLYVWSGEKYSYEQLDAALPKLETIEKAPKQRQSQALALTTEAPPKQTKSRGSAQGFKPEKKARVTSSNIAKDKKNLINQFYDLITSYSYIGRRPEDSRKQLKQHLSNISKAEQGTVHKTLLSEARKIFGLVFAGLNINKAFDELYKVTEERVSQQPDGDIDAAYRTINEALRYAIDNNWEEGFLVEKSVRKFDADVTINEQYLPSSILRYLDDARILAIKSPIGTGKTTLFRNLIESSNCNNYANVKTNVDTVVARLKNNPLERIIILLHRKTLIKNLDSALAKYGFITYDDFSITQYGALSYHDRLIITYDSLPKLTNQYDCHFSYDLMIADEADQAFDHLVQSKTEIANHRQAALNIFTSLVSTSKNVILTSATLSNDEISFISNFTAKGRADIKTIINVHKPINHDFIQYLDKEVILKKINKYVNEGRKIAIATNSKAEAEAIHEMIEEKYKNKKISLITPDTFEENVEVVNALIDAELPLDIDVLIYSPVLGTGFDISRLYFDYVFGVFSKSHSLSAEDLLQMCGRVRAPLSSQIHVFVEEGAIPGETDAKKIRASFYEICNCPTKADDKIREVVSVNKTVNDAQLNYLSKCIARKNRSLFNLFANFWHLVKLDGHTITRVGERDNEKSNVKQVKEIKKQNREVNVESIVNAPDINSLEKSKLDKKVNKTKEEKSSLDKYFFKYATGFNEPSKDDIKWYVQDGGKKACKNIELLLMPMEVANIKDFDEKRLEGKKTQVDFSNFTKRKVLLEQLIKLIDAAKDENGFFNGDSLKTSGFTTFAEGALEEIQIYLGFRPDLTKPMRTAKAVLRAVGLEIKPERITIEVTEEKEEKKKKQDTEQIRVYKITDDSLGRRNMIIANIREARLKQWRNDLHSILCNPKYAACAEVQDVASFKNEIKTWLSAESLLV